MNSYTKTKINELIHEITGVADVRKHLDLKKLPASYSNILDTKEPKLKKIINFLKSNPEEAEILFLYIDHLQIEAGESICNRNKIIEIMCKNLGDLEFKYQKNVYFFNFVTKNRDKSFNFDYRFNNGEIIKAGTVLKVKDVIKIFFETFKNSSYINEIKKRLKNDEAEQVAEIDILISMENIYYDKQQKISKQKKTMKQHR